MSTVFNLPALGGSAREHNDLGATVLAASHCVLAVTRFKDSGARLYQMLLLGFRFYI